MAQHSRFLISMSFIALVTACSGASFSSSMPIRNKMSTKASPGGEFIPTGSGSQTGANGAEPGPEHLPNHVVVPEQARTQENPVRSLSFSSAIACPPGGDDDPRRFKESPKGAPVDFFESADAGVADFEQMMTGGPSLALGLWISDSDSGVDTQGQLPTPQNFLPVGTVTAGWEVKGANKNAANHAGKTQSVITEVGSGAQVSAAALLASGVKNVTESVRGSSGPYYLYAGAMVCNRLEGGGLVSGVPRRDALLRFMNVELPARLATTKLNAFKGAAARWSYASNIISVSLDESGQFTPGFSDSLLLTAAEKLASAPSLEVLQKDPEGAAALARLNSVKEILAKNGACAEISNLVGSGQARWRAETNWSPLELGSACKVLQGAGGSDFASLLGGLSTSYLSSRDELVQRLRRAEVYALAAASLPAQWSSGPRCFARAGASRYLHSVLHSIVLPLTVQGGNVVMKTEMFPIPDSSILHPEPSFAIQTNAAYLDPTSGDLQTVFGMFRYPGLSGVQGGSSSRPVPGLEGFMGAAAINLSSNLSVLSAKLDGGTGYQAGQFLDKDIAVKFLLRRYSFCSSSSREYC